ncbi:MAG: class I SAM-dependent methyltransferase [Planctomycetaceae bacterium]
MADRSLLDMHEIPCPLCGNGDHIPCLRTPDWTGWVSGEFQLVRCRNCRHVFLNPAPVDTSLAACYPHDYGPHQRAIEQRATPAQSPGPSVDSNSAAVPVAERQPWYLSPIMRRIPGPRAFYRWVTDTKSVWIPPGSGTGKRGLELGCSSGWFLAQLRDRGWSPVGLDLVAGPLAQARAAGFEVYEGTLDSIPFHAESFDAVFAWMVLEHVPRPRETLCAVHRVLKPRGWFAFSVPNVSCWEPMLFGRHWRGYDLPRHLQHFSSRGLQSLLEDNGFQIESIIHQPSFLYWTSSLGSRLRAIAPRWSLGARLMGEYENNPPLAWSLWLGPWARLNAAIKQSGRITVVTRRR